MTNVFKDQQKFMEACDQSTDKQNLNQYLLYETLILEEVQELREADTEEDRLDALIDILVVTVGAIHSMGADGEGAWREVMQTNFAKIDGATGKVIKRADGKILKTANWQPPKLAPFLKRTTD